MSGLTQDPKQIGLVLPFTMTTGMVAMEVASALSLMTIPFPGRQIGPRDRGRPQCDEVMRASRHKQKVRCTRQRRPLYRKA
jgi:hypothetical protein